MNDFFSDVEKCQRCKGTHRRVLFHPLSFHEQYTDENLLIFDRIKSARERRLALIHEAEQLLEDASMGFKTLQRAK